MTVPAGASWRRIQASKSASMRASDSRLSAMSFGPVHHPDMGVERGASPPADAGVPPPCRLSACCHASATVWLHTVASGMALKPSPVRLLECLVVGHAVARPL